MAIFNIDNLHTVLFADDRDSADVTKQLLLQAGVSHPRHLRDIDEAFDICFRMTIDILLIDMDSSSDSGKQLIRKLRAAAIEQEFNTRILALIGTKEEEAVLSVASCGVDSIMMKPIAPDAMKKRLVKIHEMEVNYLKFDGYYGPDRRIMPDRLPAGEIDKRSIDEDVT